jgi:hypothetical protein
VFVGKELELVSFASYTVRFQFGGDVAVTLESCLRLRHAEAAGWQLQELPLESSDLMRLIGRTVASASGDSEGTLSLHFEHGATLEFLDPTPQFEAYQIHLGDYTIYV